MKTISKTMIPWVVAISFLMETLDSTILSSAIPKIAASFHVSPISLKIALVCYILTLAIFIPISGWVADRFGTKNTFISAIALFTVSSLLCGLSRNLPELIIARILQGLGGALTTPVARLILIQNFPKAELVRAMVYVSIPALLGPTLGPALGGIIVSFFHWQWIFFINIPVGIGAMLLASRYFTNHYADESPPFDIAGFLLFGCSLAGLSLGFESIGEAFLPPLQIILLMVFSGLGLLAYLAHYRRTKYPVFDLKVFRIPSFRIATLSGSLCRISLGGINFLLTLFFQIGFGWRPLHAGLLICCVGAGMLSGKSLITKSLKNYGFKKTLLWNTCVLGTLMMIFSAINPTTDYPKIILLLFCYGMSASLQYSALNILSYSNVPPLQQSQSTSIASTMMQISFSFGIGLSALLLIIYSGFQPTNLHASHLAIFHNTFITLGILTICTAFSFRVLSEREGEETSGHRH